MKPIQSTELYKVFLNNTKQVNDDTAVQYHMFQTDVVLSIYRYYHISDGSEYAKENLAYHATLDVLKMCGITDKDLELLQIAKELAKEDE